MLYRQFTLKHENTHTSCWLPESKKGIRLEVGVRITLEGQDDTWWTVQSVGSRTRTKSEVREKERQARRYRQATDI